MVKKITLLFVFLLLFSSMTLAKDPKTSSGANNLQIEYPLIDSYKFGEDMTFHFHIFNQENGMPITAADTLNCSFHLYNKSQNHIYRTWFDETDIEDTYDIEVDIDQNNYTYKGIYSYIFQCWCDDCSIIADFDDLGGFVESTFEITTSGDMEVFQPEASFGIIFYLLGISLVLFGLGYSKRRFNKFDITNFILKNMCLAGSIWFMVLNSVIVLTIAESASLGLYQELFTYTWFFGWLGYAMIIFLTFSTLIKAINMWKVDKKKRRYG